MRPGLKSALSNQIRAISGTKQPQLGLAPEKLTEIIYSSAKKLWGSYWRVRCLHELNMATYPIMTDSNSCRTGICLHPIKFSVELLLSHAASRKPPLDRLARETTVGCRCQGFRPEETRRNIAQCPSITHGSMLSRPIAIRMLYFFAAVQRKRARKICLPERRSWLVPAL